MRVLVVATKSAFVTELGIYLTLEGAGVTLVPYWDTALALSSTSEFDVVLVDLQKPAFDAARIISNVQATCQGTPILVLNAEPGSLPSACADTMSGLSLTNPKVLSRLRAIVRRSQGYGERILRAGSMQLNQATQEVLVNGTEVDLTPREFDLLEILMMHTDTVLTKEAVLSCLYGGVDEPSPKIVDVLVCKLRCKLDQAGARLVISTTYGRGYTISGVSRVNVCPIPAVISRPEYDDGAKSYGFL